jgi:hypothetical protein
MHVSITEYFKYHESDFKPAFEPENSQNRGVSIFENQALNEPLLQSVLSSFQSSEKGPKKAKTTKFQKS